MFPALLNELAKGDPPGRLDDEQYLEALRDAALILLYRLLFVLYAEDRKPLPVDDKRYDEYALRRMRQSASQDG
ncbi:MAG: hypothetical protein H0W33_02985 [Gammaproteobacteria bacterium]|nr:hypothetical protein [Gammaproteobacteria bacterium]